MAEGITPLSHPTRLPRTGTPPWRCSHVWSHICNRTHELVMKCRVALLCVAGVWRVRPSGQASGSGRSLEAQRAVPHQQSRTVTRAAAHGPRTTESVPSPCLPRTSNAELAVFIFTFHETPSAATPISVSWFLAAISCIIARRRLSVAPVVLHQHMRHRWLSVLYGPVFEDSNSKATGMYMEAGRSAL